MTVNDHATVEVVHVSFVSTLIFPQHSKIASFRSDLVWSFAAVRSVENDGPQELASLDTARADPAQQIDAFGVVSKEFACD